MHDIDLLAALPAPRDDEPPSLRSDIVDELLDHLHCAFRREVLKDGDAAAAEKRVLARFGDPKQLARRLWWQAMWSRVMGKKILSGLQWLLTLAAVFLAGAVLWQQSQILTEMNAQRAAEANWRGSLQVTLNDLRNRLPTPVGSTGTAYLPGEIGGLMGSGDSGGGSASMSMPGGPMSSTNDVPTSFPDSATGGGGTAADPFTSQQPQRRPTLTVLLVQDKEDGPPVTGVISGILLRSSTQAINGSPEQMSFGGAGGGSAGAGAVGAPYGGQPTNSANGQFTFDNLQPDRYHLTIELADGQISDQQFVIRDDKPRELLVICPGARKKAPVLITVPPLPQDLQGIPLVCQIESEPLQLGSTQWNLKNRDVLQVTFNSRTGEVSQIQGSGSQVEFAGDEQQDRTVFLFAGPVKVELGFGPFQENGWGGWRRGRSGYPPQAGIRSADDPQPRIVLPGENRWELEIPEELLAKARSQFRATATLPDPEPVTPESPPATESPNEPAEPTIDLPRVNASASREPLGDKCRLIVKLTSETKDGPAPEGAVVSLLEQGSARTFPLHAESDEFVTKPIPAGRYSLKVALPVGPELTEKLPLLRPGQERREEIICPPQAPKTTVLITAPAVPEDLRTIKETLKQPRAGGGIGGRVGGAGIGGRLAGGGGINPGAGGLAAGRAGRGAHPGAGTADVYLRVHLYSGFSQDFEGRDWTRFPIVSEELMFDPETGLLTSFQKLQFKDEPAEDRALILHSGEYRAALVSLYAVIVGEERRLALWPPYPNRAVTDEDVKQIQSQQQQFTAGPGENKWEIQVPDDFWAEARKTLAELEAKATGGEPATKPPREPGESQPPPPANKEQPADEPTKP